MALHQLTLFLTGFSKKSIPSDLLVRFYLVYLVYFWTLDHGIDQKQPVQIWMETGVNFRKSRISKLRVDSGHPAVT